MQELEKEITLRREYWESAIQARLELLLITVARSIAEETERVHVAAQTKAEFQKLRLKMMQSLEQKWDVERMAAEVAISPSWFFPLYRSVFGVSPNKDLILGRVEKAKQRLEGSDISIKELAEECGYTNEYHFIRQFRLVTGLTPKQYRITCRK